MTRVLVIDDNALDRKIARDALTHEGFEVETASDGATGLRAFYVFQPDVVVLDVLMPVLDGWTVCQRVRELSSVPIIMLTALNRDEEMVRGLDLGADDFVAKPISPSHLVARVRAAIRRAQAPPHAQAALLYDDGILSINVLEHWVHICDTAIDLTPTEFRLLVALAQAPHRVHTSAALLAQVWGPEYVDDVDFLRVYVWRLRKKLEGDSETPRWIHTERGFGYRFTEARGELGRIGRSP
jgi:DNA-binding response OmpR family regulator